MNQLLFGRSGTIKLQRTRGLTNTQCTSRLPVAYSRSPSIATSVDSRGSRADNNIGGRCISGEEDSVTNGASRGDSDSDERFIFEDDDFSHWAEVKTWDNVYRERQLIGEGSAEVTAGSELEQDLKELFGHDSVDSKPSPSDQTIRDSVDKLVYDIIHEKLRACINQLQNECNRHQFRAKIRNEKELREKKRRMVEAGRIMSDFVRGMGMDFGKDVLRALKAFERE